MLAVEGASEEVPQRVIGMFVCEVKCRKGDKSNHFCKIKRRQANANAKQPLSNPPESLIASTIWKIRQSKSKCKIADKGKGSFWLNSNNHDSKQLK